MQKGVSARNDLDEDIRGDLENSRYKGVFNID